VLYCRSSFSPARPGVYAAEQDFLFSVTALAAYSPACDSIFPARWDGLPSAVVAVSGSCSVVNRRCQSIRVVALAFSQHRPDLASFCCIHRRFWQASFCVLLLSFVPWLSCTVRSTAPAKSTARAPGSWVIPRYPGFGSRYAPESILAAGLFCCSQFWSAARAFRLIREVLLRNAAMFVWFDFSCSCVVLCRSQSYSWVAGSKTRVFLILVVFLWWFLAHTRKMFVKMSERVWGALLVQF
jgi:hypothetical protein